MNKHTEHQRKRAASIGDRKPIHHSPLFWVGAVLFVLAITVYLSTLDLSWRPWSQPTTQPASSGTR